MQTMSCIAAIEKNYTTGREVSIILARELDSHAQLHIKLWTTVNIEMVILCEFHSVITVNRTNADVHRTAINGCDLFHSLSSWLLRFSLVIVGDDDLNYLFNWFGALIWIGQINWLDLFSVRATPMMCCAAQSCIARHLIRIRLVLFEGGFGFIHRNCRIRSNKKMPLTVNENSSVLFNISIRAFCANRNIPSCWCKTHPKYEAHHK